MEPASPLKSITNTAQLAPSQTKQQSQSNGTTTATALTNGTNKSIEENNFSLWPPNSALNKDSSANNRKFNSFKLDSLSTSHDNDNSFFYHMITNTNGNGISSNNNLNNNTNNGINLSKSDNNGLSNGFHIAATNNNKQQQNVITKNGFDSQHLTISSSVTSNLENNNLFTPDADFVADFGSANIFNAMNGKTSSNIQHSIANPQNHMNGNNNNNNHTNGFDKVPNGISRIDDNSNGFTMNTSNGNASENFADFEHNTIYNAAGNFVEFFCLK